MTQYEHYRQQKQVAAEKLAEAVSDMDLRHLPFSVQEALIDYQHADAMMQSHEEKKKERPSTPKPSKNHYWRKQQILGKSRRSRKG